MTTRTVPLTPQSAAAVQTVRESGSFEGALYAFTRTLSLVDQVGIHLNRANIAPDTRNEIPTKVGEVLAALAYTKRILSQIQRCVVEQDKLEEQRIQAMARGDQTRVAQVNVRAGELRQTLHHLCRGFDVGTDDDEN